MLRNPAVFFSHHKCATAWLRELLKTCGGQFGLSFFFTHFSNGLPPGAERRDVMLFTNSFYDSSVGACGEWLAGSDVPALHVIRNPLDLVVSAYYSHKAVHRADRWAELARQRDILQKLDKTTGMASTWNFLERIDFDKGVVGPLFAMRRWNYSDARVRTIRMEDLVNDTQFARRELQVRLGADPVEILDLYRFEQITGGRPKGVVDDQHHFRSGKRDQWLDEMALPLAEAIYETYRELIDAFYPDVRNQLARKRSGVAVGPAKT